MYMGVGVGCASARVHMHVCACVCESPSGAKAHACTQTGYSTVTMDNIHLLRVFEFNVSKYYMSS